MSIHLEKIRLFATTKDQSDAGTDSGVDLWYFVNSHSLTTWRPEDKGAWRQQELDHPWNDRERGRTEMYEVNLHGGIGINIGGVNVPSGIAFNDFSHARTAMFWLRMKGDDWWRIDHYFLLGSFKELRLEQSQVIDHGWLLMARRDGDVDMSTDPSEGATWHFIDLNGTFACNLILPTTTLAFAPTISGRAETSGS